MSDTARGVRFVLGSAFAFSVMSLFGKWAGARGPSQEIVLARSVLSFAMSFALLRRAGVSPLGNRRGLLVLRGPYGFGGLSCAYYAPTHPPPPPRAPPAVRVLGARPAPRLALSIAASTAGVVLVTRPFGLLSSGAPALDPVAVAV